MPKRTIDEIDADSQTNGATQIVTKRKKKGAKEGKDTKDKKSRKGKDKDKKLETAVVDDVTHSEKSHKPSKEERKAIKAARKATKIAAKAAKVCKDSTNNGEPSTNGELCNNTSVATPSGISFPSPGCYLEHPELAALPQPTIDEYLTKSFISFVDPLNAPKLRPIIKFTHFPIEDKKQQKSFLSFTSAFTTPTPIQSAVWPYLLAGRDCIGVAETGSGKTLAFGVPAIRRVSSLPIEERRCIKVLIVSPTRELAMQIHEHLEKLTKNDGLTTVCVYGGVPKEEQRRLLKTATIVVATPGRLKDLMEEGVADIRKVDYLVLDEADRMLDKGFEEDIRKIISVTSPVKRQTLMFTATWPPSVRALASSFMKSPVHFVIGDNPTGELRANTRINQTVEVIDHFAKEGRLHELLKEHQFKNGKMDRILVFCLYKKEAVRIESFLQRKGYQVAAIHGDLNQGQRTQALQSFKDGKCPILIATDVAARGLDIPKVKLVINVTFPLTIEDYVHRIGRTGRAGDSGKAVTLFTEHDKPHSGALVNVLKAAGQQVPEALLKFGTTVKKKEHSIYGAFFKDTEGAGTAKKIKFSE